MDGTINEGAAKPRVTPLNQPKIFSHGTLECHNLAASRPFYEEFLGLDCVRHAKKAMMLRKGLYFGLVCLEKGARVRPVGVGNHWGMDLGTKEEVDRAHALAIEHKERYGIQKVMRITEMHGTYAFYFQDLDGNWWEFQYVGEGQENGTGRYDKHFARGDVVDMSVDTSGEDDNEPEPQE
jgi:catechol 2,3-dioxygenase-like lactoylglutathione lyase family enzyme